MARRKRVQVGWYCDHTDEPYGKGTHMASHGRYRRGKWVDSFPEPNVSKSLAMLDYRNPKERPHCAKAVPVYIYVMPDEQAQTDA